MIENMIKILTITLVFMAVAFFFIAIAIKSMKKIYKNIDKKEKELKRRKS